MTAFKIVCYLVTGAAVGSVGTVAVNKQHSPKPVAAKAKERGVLTASRPRVVRPEPAQPPAPRILDCPTPALGSPFAFDPAPLPSLSGGAGVWLEQRSPDGGLVFLPRQAPNPFPPAVPEPAAWLMWVAGFGLVGSSMRRTKRENHHHSR